MCRLSRMNPLAGRRVSRSGFRVNPGQCRNVEAKFRLRVVRRADVDRSKTFWTESGRGGAQKYPTPHNDKAVTKFHREIAEADMLICRFERANSGEEVVNEFLIVGI